YNKVFLQEHIRNLHTCLKSTLKWAKARPGYPTGPIGGGGLGLLLVWHTARAYLRESVVLRGDLAVVEATTGVELRVLLLASCGAHIRGSALVSNRTEPVQLPVVEDTDVVLIFLCSRHREAEQS